jgi:hypothetical protein
MSQQLIPFARDVAANLLANLLGGYIDRDWLPDLPESKNFAPRTRICLSNVQERIYKFLQQP